MTTAVSLEAAPLKTANTFTIMTEIEEKIKAERYQLL
jgi:hypothetical protein